FLCNTPSLCGITSPSTGQRENGHIGSLPQTMGFTNRKCFPHLIYMCVCPCPHVLSLSVSVFLSLTHTHTRHHTHTHTHAHTFHTALHRPTFFCTHVCAVREEEIG